ncbi:MAG: hypothetical protein Q8O03_01275, partial [Nanoarchaeota archaeon]|nr:hypothetical protein [Nanoarchaeota archaeon]
TMTNKILKKILLMKKTRKMKTNRKTKMTMKKIMKTINEFTKGVLGVDHVYTGSLLGGCHEHEGRIRTLQS